MINCISENRTDSYIIKNTIQYQTSNGSKFKRILQVILSVYLKLLNTVGDFQSLNKYFRIGGKDLKFINKLLVGFKTEHQIVSIEFLIKTDNQAQEVPQ